MLIITPRLVSQDAGWHARLLRRTVAFPTTSTNIAIATWEMADSGVGEAVFCLDEVGPEGETAGEEEKNLHLYSNWDFRLVVPMSGRKEKFE